MSETHNYCEANGVCQAQDGLREAQEGQNQLAIKCSVLQTAIINAIRVTNSGPYYAGRFDELNTYLRKTLASLEGKT